MKINICMIENMLKLFSLCVHEKQRGNKHTSSITAEDGSRSDCDIKMHYIISK